MGTSPSGRRFCSRSEVACRRISSKIAQQRVKIPIFFRRAPHCARESNKFLIQLLSTSPPHQQELTQGQQQSRRNELGEAPAEPNQPLEADEFVGHHPARPPIKLLNRDATVRARPSQLRRTSRTKQQLGSRAKENCARAGAASSPWGSRVL